MMGGDDVVTVGSPVVDYEQLEREVVRLTHALAGSRSAALANRSRWRNARRDFVAIRDEKRQLTRAVYALVQIIEDTGGVWDDPDYFDADMRGAVMAAIDRHPSVPMEDMPHTECCTVPEHQETTRIICPCVGFDSRCHQCPDPDQLPPCMATPSHPAPSDTQPAEATNTLGPECPPRLKG